MNIGDKKDEDSRLSAEPESDLTSAETRIMPVSPNDGVTGSSEDYESPKRVVPIPAVEFEELNAAWQQSDPTLKKTLPPFDPDSLPFRSASYSDGSFDLRSLESQPKNGRVARWIFVALGALILLLLIVIAGVGIYWYTRRPIETTKTAAIADAPATSDPFGSALASLVKLSFIDSNGKPTGETNGFYVADQMVVCSLAAMRNSIRGYATLAGQNSNFEVAGISSINPENGLALVRISSLKAPLLPLPSALPSENQAAAGEQVIIIVDNSSINNRINATITGFRVEDGLMMLKANNDSSHLTRALDGSPVLNKSGEVVAMMTHDETDAVLAVSLSSIKKLVDGARGEYTLAAAGATDVFYDFRSDFRGARSDVVKNDEIPEDTREGVLRAIFGDKLNNRDECFSPQILSAANGSFTSANGGVGAQTAYIIGLGNLGNSGNCGQPATTETTRLVIFSGRTAIVNVDAQKYNRIVAVTDINGDGTNELLLENEVKKMGNLTINSSIADIEQSRLRLIKDFGITYINSCATERANGFVAASLIYRSSAANKQMPDFRIDNYRAGCEGKNAPLPVEQFKVEQFKYVNSK